MAQEQLFASFIFDKQEGLEIALRAESVAEATPISGKIQRLPASVDFVEGLMHLRDEVIPIINLKKRLGLDEQSYNDEAKVAVVRLFHRRYGLLFDDILEVFAAGDDDVHELDRALQTDDKIISALILREKGKRTVELMDLGSLFSENSVELEKAGAALPGDQGKIKEKSYSRFVVFGVSGQLYGVPVGVTQEISFVDAIHEMYSREDESGNGFSGSLEDIFKHGDIDGTLKLWGRTVPVLSARRLLFGGGSEAETFNDSTRLLVLANDGCYVALIVEEVTAIEAIPDDEILTVDIGATGGEGISGIYQKSDGSNITILHMEKLVCDRIEELKAMNRLSEEFDALEETDASTNVDGAHHLITENCYLVFSIGKSMAVQLKDVQEIIEKEGVLSLPGETGFRAGVINLRGKVVPVINLRNFFGYEVTEQTSAEKKLVICKTGSRIVALEVDSIVTIYKQEKYQNTSSMHPDLAKKEDVLDRLIAFDGGAATKEHVLVLNIHNLIRNHIDVATV